VNSTRSESGGFLFTGFSWLSGQGVQCEWEKYARGRGPPSRARLHASRWIDGMSSWLAAYQRAVDNATSHSKNLREYVADKQASLGTLEEAGRQLREAVSSVTTTVAQTAQRATSSATATIQTVQRATTARNELMEREMAREMSAYGITDEYVEAVRSKLEYGIFRDHQLDDRVCAGPSGRDDDDDDDDDDQWCLRLVSYPGETEVAFGLVASACAARFTRRAFEGD